MSYVIEVDQSYRTDDLTSDTALAFSNGICRAILLPREVKRAVYFRLADRGVKRYMRFIRMFVGGVFFLLEDHLGDC